MIRRTLIWLAIGVALGVVLSMWLGPWLMSWRYAVPGQPAALSCASGVQSALQTFVHIQLAIGAGFGVLLAVLAHLFARRRGAKATSSAK